MLGIDGVKMRENRVWDAFFWVLSVKKYMRVTMLVKACYYARF